MLCNSSVINQNVGLTLYPSLVPRPPPRKRPGNEASHTLLLFFGMCFNYAWKWKSGVEAWEHWSHEWCKVDVEVVEPILPSTIWLDSSTPTLADSQDYSAWLNLNLLWSVWHLCRSTPTPTLVSTWCQSRDNCSRTFSTLLFSLQTEE